MRVDHRQSLGMAVVIACAFFYFLIFAQFAFLHRLSEVDPKGALLDLSMLCMGLGGVLSCVVVAKFFQKEIAIAWIVAGFIGCGVLAPLVGLFPVMGMFPVYGFGIGFSVGLLTVSIASSLRSRLPIKSLGLWTGCGVGAAYAISNVPIVFRSESIDHCLMAGVACLLGALVCIGLFSTDEEELGGELDRPLFRYLNSGGIWLACGFFLVLVWFDSAAFFVIQETADLKGQSWGGESMLWYNSIVHFVVSVLAGWLLDRGVLMGLWIGSLLGLILGLVGLQAGYPSWATASTFIYVAAVSGYSTALTAFVGLTEDRDGMWSAQSRAAFIYGVAGWFGSAMGIGMAKDLHRVPIAFIAIVMLYFVVAGLWFLRVQRGFREKLMG